METDNSFSTFTPARVPETAPKPIREWLRRVHPEDPLPHPANRITRASDQSAEPMVINEDSHSTAPSSPHGSSGKSSNRDPFKQNALENSATEASSVETESDATFGTIFIDDRNDDAQPVEAPVFGQAIVVYYTASSASGTQVLAANAAPSTLLEWESTRSECTIIAPEKQEPWPERDEERSSIVVYSSGAS